MKIEVLFPRKAKVVEVISKHFDDPELINFMTYEEMCEVYCEIKFCEIGLVDPEIFGWEEV